MSNGYEISDINWCDIILCGIVPDLQAGGCEIESWPGLLRTKVDSAFHPPGSVIEYQLQLGRHRQMLIPLDILYVCKLAMSIHTWLAECDAPQAYAPRSAGRRAEPITCRWTWI